MSKPGLIDCVGYVLRTNPHMPPEAAVKYIRHKSRMSFSVSEYELLRASYLSANPHVVIPKEDDSCLLF